MVSVASTGVHRDKMSISLDTFQILVDFGRLGRQERWRREQILHEYSAVLDLMYLIISIDGRDPVHTV